MKLKSLNKATIAVFIIAALITPVYGSSAAASEWALPYIEAMESKDLIPSTLTSDGSYKDEISREKFCELIVEYMKAVPGVQIKSGPEPFNDTNNPAVALAYTMGVVSGTTSDTFSPNATATREQISAMISRAETALGSAKPTNSDVSKFKDAAQIENYAKPAIRQLSDSGAVAGFPDGTFHPKDTMTEEQAIKVIAVQAQKRGVVKINLPSNQPQAGSMQYPNDSILQKMFEAQSGYKSIDVTKQGFFCYYGKTKNQFTAPDFSAAYDNDGTLSIRISGTQVNNPATMKTLQALVGADAQKVLNAAIALGDSGTKELTIQNKVLFLVSDNGENIEIAWIKE